MLKIRIQTKREPCAGLVRVDTLLPPPRQMDSERKEGDEEVLRKKRAENASWRDAVRAEDSGNSEVKRVCGY